MTKTKTETPLRELFPQTQKFNPELAADQLYAISVGLETPLKAFADRLDAILLLPPEELQKLASEALPELHRLIWFIEMIRYNSKWIGEKHLTSVIRSQVK